MALLIIMIMVVIPILAIICASIAESLVYMLYEPSKFKPILNQYTGNCKMQILRALSDGAIKTSDIRSYYNYGVSGSLSRTLEEYRLLWQFSSREECECEIVTKHSGCYRSTLHEIELEIKRGKGVITKHWHTA